MDNTTLSLFIHELRNQCIYTEAAFRVFNQSLQEGASAGAFFAGQSILLSASQIGAILWPSRARAKSRGESLRNALNLGESHPLADRRLTCLWDFGDEKLEEWIFDTKGEQVIFDHLGPVPRLREQALPDLNLYRLYDPTTQIFYFRGNGFKLQAIADAIADVFKRVTALHRQLLPDQYRPAPTGSREATPPVTGEATNATGAGSMGLDKPIDEPQPQETVERGPTVAKPDREPKEVKKAQQKKTSQLARKGSQRSRSKAKKPSKPKKEMPSDKPAQSKESKSPKRKVQPAKRKPNGKS